MKMIAIVEDGYVRDSLIYTGDPANIDEGTDWENDFSDVKIPCQYIGIFNGETIDEIKRKAADYEGIHPGTVTLIDMDGGAVHA